MELNTISDIPSFARTIFSDALNRRASDIHVDPGAQSIRVRFRIDGSLYDYVSISMLYYEQLMSHFKILAELDTTSVFTPQDGHLSLNYVHEDEVTHVNTPFVIDLRISLFPTVYGDAAVFRVANSLSHVLHLDGLGMSPTSLIKVKKILKKNTGMVLVTGPVGSGKTSTLYAVLNEVMDSDRNAITLEDPVEFRFEKIRQVQVNPEKGFSYAIGMKSILRQDPDIIMLGEIRDSETAEHAIRAALVGRVVFSTIHANSSVGTIARLIDMKVEKSLVAYSLNAVIATRLVKKNCEKCLEEYTPAQEYLAYFPYDLSKVKFYHGKGCDVCDGKGYLGRVGIFEILEFDTALRSMIVEGAPMSAIQKLVDTNGTKTLRDDALEKIQLGLIAIENAVTVI